MTLRVRLMLLTLAAALLLLPVLALHPLLVHVSREGGTEFHRGILSPGFIALSAIAFAGIAPVFGFLSAVRTAGKARRSVARLLSSAEPRTAGDIRYFRVPEEGVALLTVGFWRPSIVVTAGAEASLSQKELHAALLHEQAHQRRRDVLWRALLVAVANSFGVLPWVRSLVAKGILHSECLADDEAIRSGASRKALFEAMVTASTGRSRAVGASLVDGAVEYRLLRIARSEQSLPPGPSTGLAAVLAAAVALPLAGHAILVVGLVCGSHLG